MEAWMYGNRVSTATQKSIPASALPYAIMVVTGRKWVHVLLSIGGTAGTGLFIVGVRMMMGGG